MAHMGDYDNLDEIMESEVQDTKHMKFVDGRCSCCPYGYHIDLDFMRYLDGLNSDSTLHDLKKIHRDKKKLRKSMEVFLKQQEMATYTEGSGPPPDVVHSSENFMTIMEKDKTGTTEILDEFDSSVNATLSSIDQHLMYSRSKQLPGDITDSDLESPSPTMKRAHFAIPPQQQEHRYYSGTTEQTFHNQAEERHSSKSDIEQNRHYRSDAERDLRYRTEAEFLLNHPPKGIGKSDSVSSLSSQSTISSEHFSPNTSGVQNQYSSSTKRTFVTSAQLADSMASLFSNAEQHHGSGESSASLQAIRQQMAFSLQRMKELEEQVKAIPVLQVRISVLKEEKRLLMLQLKAKHNKLNMRSIGTGDAHIDDSHYSMNVNHMSQYNMGYMMNGNLQKPRPEMRSIGVGDFNVVDNALVQVVGGYPSTIKLHERELHTEANTHVHEKEVKTVFLSQGSESMDESLSFRPKVAPKPPRKPSRSIGVGEGNVFDSSSNVHFHQKELRTVFIGDESKGKPLQRNVGILCKPASRDVGVTYMYENEVPPTRSIAVGVGEMGIDGELMLADGEEGEGGWNSNSSSTTVHNTMQQMNMAAFHTKHIHIKNEVLRAIIDEKLRKTVNSKSTQCSFSMDDKIDKGTQVKGLEDKKSIGCGDDTVNVTVTEIKKTRSVGIETKPSVTNRASITDKLYTVDMGTNTVEKVKNTTQRSTNTTPVVSFPASTNTERQMQFNATTETDIRVFQTLGQLVNTGVGTQQVERVNTAVNTEHKKQLVHQNFDFNISFREVGVQKNAAPKNTWDRGINTQSVRTYDRGINTHPVPSYAKAVNTDHRLNQINRGSMTEAPRVYSIGVGSESIKELPLSPTSPQFSESVVIHKVHSLDQGSQEAVGYPQSPNTQQATYKTQFDRDRSRSSSTDGDLSNQGVRITTTTTTQRAGRGDNSRLMDFDGVDTTGLSKMVTREVVRKTESKLGSLRSNSGDFDDSGSDGFGNRDGGSSGSYRMTVENSSTRGSGGSGFISSSHKSTADSSLGSPKVGSYSDSLESSGQEGSGFSYTSAGGAVIGGGRGSSSLSNAGGISNSGGVSKTVTYSSSNGGNSSGRGEGSYSNSYESSSRGGRGGGSSNAGEVSSVGDVSKTVTYSSSGGGNSSGRGEDSYSSSYESSSRGGRGGGSSNAGEVSSVGDVSKTVTYSSSGGGNSSGRGEGSYSSSYESSSRGGRGGGSSNAGGVSAGGVSKTVTYSSSGGGNSSGRGEGSYSSSYESSSEGGRGGGSGGSSFSTSTTRTVIRGSGSEGLSGSEAGNMGSILDGGVNESSGMSRTYKTTTSKLLGEGSSDLSMDRSDNSHMFDASGGGSSGMTVKTTTTKSSRGSGHLVPKQPEDYMFLSNESALSSSGGGGGSDDFVFETIEGGSGGTQMRIIRNTETTYVGGKPVKRSSNVVVRDSNDSPGDSSTDLSMSAGDTSHTSVVDGGGSHAGVQSTTSRTVTHSRGGGGQMVQETTNRQSGTAMQDSGVITSPDGEAYLQFAEAGNLTTQAMLHGGAVGGSRGHKVITITETKMNRQSGSVDSDSSSNGGLRSIMKHPGDVALRQEQQTKKEIKFSEDVVGGYVSSSDEEVDEEDSEDASGGEVEAEQTEPAAEAATPRLAKADDSSGGDSDESFDEGSYDGRQGKIVYRCKDNEAIEQGAPGAAMYDHNIRETFELGAEMMQACQVYAQFLEDSTQVTSRQLNTSVNLIQQEWFKASSHKLSSGSQVEDYLNCFNEISQHLLTNVVNMADANGNTALHYAVSHCNMEIVNLLLDTELCEVNKQNKAGYTAMMLASLTQVQTDPDRDVIRRLFSMGDVNAQASQAGQTALMLAVSHGRADMVRMLLDTGASVNIQDEDGSTALMCASEHGHTEIVKMLLAHTDSDPTLTDNDGSTALSIAMEAGHRDIGVLLYAHVNFKQNSPVLVRGKLKKRSSSRSSSTSSISSQTSDTGYPRK